MFAKRSDSKSGDEEKGFSRIWLIVVMALGACALAWLLAADAEASEQADSPPVSGHYPTTSWQPGQIIQDVHPLPATDLSQIDHLAIGLYDPVTGERMPAFGPNGERLVDDAFVVPLK